MASNIGDDVRLFHGGLEPGFRPNGIDEPIFLPLTHFGTERSARDRIAYLASLHSPRYSGSKPLIIECDVPGDGPVVDIEDIGSPRPLALFNCLRDQIGDYDQNLFLHTFRRLDLESGKVELAGDEQGATQLNVRFKMHMRLLLAEILLRNDIRLMRYVNEFEDQGSTSWIRVDCREVRIIARHPFP